MNSQTLPSYDSLSRPLPIWHPKAIYPAALPGLAR